MRHKNRRTQWRVLVYQRSYNACPRPVLLRHHTEIRWQPSSQLLDMAFVELLFIREDLCPILNPHQQVDQAHVSLDPLELVQVFLAGMASERSVHLFKRLAASLWDEKVEEEEADDQPGCEEDVRACEFCQ